MDLMKIEQYSLSEKELKAALKMYFESKKGINVDNNEITFSAWVNEDGECYNFSGHIKIVENTKNV